MLLSFDSKKSLLRNLNEADPDDVYLIISNYKSLKGWHMIPLKRISIILGPNSAGKSTIYDAIDALIRCAPMMFNLEEGRIDSELNPVIGFSMPYLLYGTVQSRSMTESWLSAGFVDEDYIHLYYRLDSDEIKESFSEYRYTFIGEHIGFNRERCTWDDDLSYEVYLNSDKYSTIGVDGPDFSVDISDKADDLLLWPELQRLKCSTDKWDLELLKRVGIKSSKRPYRWDIELFLGLWDSKNVRFWNQPPKFLLSDLCHTSYDNKILAFWMVVALYYAPINRFLEVVWGADSGDIREAHQEQDTIYGPFNDHCLNSTISVDYSKYRAVSPVSSLDVLARNELLYRAVKVDEITDPKKLPRILHCINRWLSERAFLDSNYSITVAYQLQVGINLTDYKKYSETKLIEVVSALGEDYWSRAISYRASIALEDSEKRSLNFSDIGAGYTQVIPLLIWLVSRSVLLFRQPELHLHPKMQSKIADCFVETVFNERSNNVAQFRLIETHSEHFILRLLRRIREAFYDELLHSSLTLYPDDVIFLYFKPENGSTQVHSISVLPNGQFAEGWPDGFFDDRDEDLWGFIRDV